jgi:hypothetical protein
VLEASKHTGKELGDRLAQEDGGGELGVVGEKTRSGTAGKMGYSGQEGCGFMGASVTFSGKAAVRWAFLFGRGLA